MRKSVRIQLIVFCLIAAVGIVYTGARYVRLPSLLGFGEYTVNLELPDSGGVFTNAAVTYRGMQIGRVGDLTLTDDGINVELRIDSSAPKVPANARAVVANRSAIGEQYVDLRPVADSEPYLEDGSRITGGQEDLPVKVDKLLREVDSLAQSIPVDSLEVTVRELGVAVRDRGPELRELADSLIALADTGVETLPQLKTLIRDSAVVLDTQALQSPEIVDFSASMRTMTEAIRDSDSDLRRLIDTSGEFGTESSRLVAESGPALSDATARLSETLKVVDPRSKSIRVLLQLLPALSAGSLSVAPGDGTIHFGVVFETNNPPPCTLGYEGTQQIIDQMEAQDPNFDWQEQDFPPNYDARCNLPQGSISVVRGGQNAYLSDPDVTQPWDNKPKVAPDHLDLSVAAQQLAELQGLVPPSGP